MNSGVIPACCAVRFIHREVRVKPGLALQQAEFSWLCILRDSKFSFPVFPGPLSEVGLMTLFSFISFLLSAGMKREKKASCDIGGHGVNTS